MALTRYEQALAFATKKHEGQFRIGGAPYITHPVAVARYVREWGYDEDYQIMALFHDLLEDSDTTEAQILQYGNPRILQVVLLLTKQEGYEMRAYTAGIYADEAARVIKTADRLHNLSCLKETDRSFRERYLEETRQWYLDLSPKISKAVAQLTAEFAGT